MILKKIKGELIKNDSLKPGLIPRLVAWEVLQAVASGVFAEVALNSALKKYSIKGKDKSLSTEIAYGAIRQRKFLDAWIDCLAKINAKKQPPKLRWLLHIGLYQILKMTKIPPSAVVNTTVELAKNSNLSKLSSVVNAVLRNAKRAKDLGKSLPLQVDMCTHFAQEYSIPNWLARELIGWRGEDGAKAFANSVNKVPTLDIRVNTRKVSLARIQEKFSKYGIESLAIDSRSQGLQLMSGLGEISKLPGYDQGEWSVQDRSSQWIAPLLQAKPGDKILDACAAPGGKTTHIAELIGDKGEIWAVDRSSTRLKKVSDNANRLQLKSLKFLVADASLLFESKPQWRSYFQRILIDAPCSGLGTLGRNPDARWRMNPKKINELICLQGKILDGVLPLIAPGGLLVYSTCTIHPKENFEQVERFLACNLNLTLKFQKQIWPNDENGGDGFYAAVMQLTN